jgi:hypothetical protein
VDTFELYAPLSPPLYTRDGVKMQFERIHERWPLVHNASDDAKELLREVPHEEDPWIEEFEVSTDDSDESPQIALAGRTNTVHTKLRSHNLWSMTELE